MTHVWWLDGMPLCDDQQIVADLVDSHRYNNVQAPPPEGDGAVVVVPAKYHNPAEVNDLIRPLPWCVLILTSDEESTFDTNAVDHPNVRLWVMTPRPGRHYPDGTRFLGEGCRPGTRSLLRGIGYQPRSRDLFLSAQNTHGRRKELFKALASSHKPYGRDVNATEGFGQGYPRQDYLGRTATAKVIPCPSGPATPDSFRLFEALEAGCIPLPDITAPGNYPERGYWDLVYPGHPFDLVPWWRDIDKHVVAALQSWPMGAVKASAWWQRTKRQARLNLADDVADLSGLPTETHDVDDLITVLIPTSPIPSHPSTSVITETLLSVRDRLPRAEVLVMCDGVSPAHQHRRDAYGDYLHRLAWETNLQWDNVVPFVFDAHTHQVGMTRAVLPEVRTPLVLFVEHDTPLVGEVDWVGCARAVLSGDTNLIRFHHEASVLEPHRHLMVDDVPRMVEGVPLLRTVQWSQRPHLAATGAYRNWLDANWWRESDGMIEDRMHGVVENDWLQHRDPRRFRLSMYAPSGDMKRSTHLDGRGDDPKVIECE